jgi:type II secretory pathway pseudopilin PulG
LAPVLAFDGQFERVYNQVLLLRKKKMELILAVVVIVLIVFVLALLIWLISTNFASRKEVAGQAANIGLLQQQLEALKAAQDKTSENLQKSLQAGQTNLTQSLQSSQKVLSQLNTQIGELQGTNKQMMQIGTEVRRLQDILSSPKIYYRKSCPKTATNCNTHSRTAK